MSDRPEPSADQHAPMSRGALGAWWGQGARTAFFFRPDWTSLQTTPTTVAFLTLFPFALSAVLQRFYITGPAHFYWLAFQNGWVAIAIMLWACWLLSPRVRAGDESTAPSAAALFSMMLAQMLTINIVLGLIFIPMVRAGIYASNVLGAPATWTLWLLAIAWPALAQLCLVYRSGVGRRYSKLIAGGLLLCALALNSVFQPQGFWYPVEPEGNEARVEPFRLTQELMEQQQALLTHELQQLHSEGRENVHVYAITYAPYSLEDVFRRESALVASVMQDRFNTSGRTIQLVNNTATARDIPWATPLNLQRTIQRIAEVMDRDNDVLFIHLTSHGAKDGKLSTYMYPLTIEDATPQMLARWLDDAGIRYRVVSISACYSGSWIEPLSNPGTLVMTAADSDHTSYGCGSKSPITYFGKAMFDEELRHTWSFESAHAAARRSIEQREKDAGKTDGYSNPQIRVGADIKEHLRLLEAELGKTRHRQ